MAAGDAATRDAILRSEQYQIAVASERAGKTLPRLASEFGARRRKSAASLWPGRIRRTRAQTINTCLAAVYKALLLHARSCIGRSDDLVAGKSYYIVEVEAVLALVQASASTAPHLFLFDELF